MHKIGFRIRKYREEREISLEQLADLAGLSVPFLTALEEEDLLPSIAPLQKISRALGVRLGTFMDDQVTRDPIIERGSDLHEDLTIREARGKNAAFHYTALARGKSDRNMEPFIIEVAEEAGDQTSTHQGEEFIYVLEGKLRVIYGKQSHILEAGDSVYYNSITPHAVCAEGDRAKILAVLYFPM